MLRHTIFCNYFRYYNFHDCSDDCSNDSSYPTWYNNVVIPCWVCYTMLGSYCRYYSRHVIVVMIVVIRVVTKNRTWMHAIFILMPDTRCRALVLRKNCPSWTTTQRSAQRSPVHKSGEPSDDECAFLHVCCRHHNSWNVSGARDPLVSKEPFETTCLSGLGSVQ